MLRLLMMIIASGFDLLILLGILRSGKYESLVKSLPESATRELLGIGFSLIDLKVPNFRKSLIPKIKSKTTLIYGEKYADYYAYTALAKALTYTVVPLGILTSLGVMLGAGASVFFFMISILIAAFAWNASVISISDTTKKRQEQCLAAFPDMVTKFALLINSGMVIHEAWRTVANSKDEPLYELMREACNDMDNGDSEVDAIYSFGVKTNSPEIRKFTASMIQGMAKGNSELSIFLTEQAQEMLERKRQRLLQDGEKASSKLLIPIGITFVGIILIIGVGAMQSMAF